MPCVRRHSAGLAIHARLKVTLLKRYHSKAVPVGQSAMSPAAHQTHFLHGSLARRSLLPDARISVKEPRTFRKPHKETPS
jgi:hypothetical protein